MPTTLVEPPLTAYRAALARYDPLLLRAVQEALDLPGTGIRSTAAQIAEHLENPRTLEAIVARLDPGARLALGLLGLTEGVSWPALGLMEALRCLGVEPQPPVTALSSLGILAIEGRPVVERSRARDPRAEALPPIDYSSENVTLHVHPAAPSVARTVLPEGRCPAVEGPVRQVREPDGIEPILRLAALWQRIDEVPLRQTQQGALYKRDRDRLEDDPVLAGPIADALEPIPDMALFWLSLARGVGLIESEPGSDRAVAAPPEFWPEHAFHLPQMIASRWLRLRQWHEQGGMQQEGSTVELTLPYLRPAVLLWLATHGPEDWLAIDDLAAHLYRVAPRWDRTILFESTAASAPAPAPRSRSARGSKAESGTWPATARSGIGALDSLLLGSAYQLGLVRAAEEASTGRRVVQLTGLGRYVLALGPPPPPHPVFEHFLFVQPNFEIIAYRQGLNPLLIGTFSRFAQWSQIGAALELRLTAESVYRGLEGGLTEEAILDRLKRHSARDLPAGVAEALRTWSGRRERVTYHASATLVEFATADDLERGLKLWPADRGAPVRISDRLLLVEDARAMPLERFRQAGARDYRRAPEACLEVGPDGVSLTLDLDRSDLLVDAELARFADEQPPERLPSSFSAAGPPRSPRRRFVVSPASLSRAAENGLSTTALEHWYLRRTGAEMPPAVRLLLLSTTTRVPPLATSRPLVLQAPSAQWLDGLLQHPATRDHLGDRLGPTAVIIPDGRVAPLRQALEQLGLSLALDVEAQR